MRKIMWGFLAGVLMAGVGVAQQEVFSRNAVGFIKVEVPRGVLVMLQSPFETMDGETATIGDIVGADLPEGTTAYIWSQEQQRWILPPEQVGRIGFGGDLVWSPGTNVIDRGQGFFLGIPDNASQEQYEITMMGEVPSEFTAPTSTVHLVEGLQMLGFMYPVSTNISATMLGQIASEGDTIYIWEDGAWEQPPAQFGRVGFGGTLQWVPDIVLNPGVAVFYSSTDSKPWVEQKSDYYTWP